MTFKVDLIIMEYVVDTNTHMAYGMLWIQIHIFNNDSKKMTFINTESLHDFY